MWSTLDLMTKTGTAVAVGLGVLGALIIVGGLTFVLSKVGAGGFIALPVRTAA